MTLVLNVKKYKFAKKNAPKLVFEFSSYYDLNLLILKAIRMLPIAS